MTINMQGRPFGGAIMNIVKGEKMYKVYRIIPKEYPGYHFEYRVLTKVKKDGNLEVAAYNYKVVNGLIEKGKIMISENVPKKAMDGIVNGILKQTEKVSPSYLDVVDLTKHKTLEEQIQKMVELDNVDTQYID